MLSEELFQEIDKLDESVEYRKSLVHSIFFKFFHSSNSHYQNQKDIFQQDPIVVPTGQQTYQEGHSENQFVGKSYAHSSGNLHTTGEAKYVGDIEPPKGCLEAAVVYSTVPHGKIVNIDTTEAIKSDGVVGFFCGKDFANNPISHLTQSTLITDQIVSYVGQPIGIYFLFFIFFIFLFFIFYFLIFIFYFFYFLFFIFYFYFFSIFTFYF